MLIAECANEGNESAHTNLSNCPAYFLSPAAAASVSPQNEPSPLAFDLFFEARIARDRRRYVTFPKQTTCCTTHAKLSASENRKTKASLKLKNA